MSSNISNPKSFLGVMVSSTFKDLEKHRAILIEALRKQDLVPRAMEDYVLEADDDVISSSLRMVQEGAAYIGLISRRYGQILDDPQNPKGYSVTRLEFEEAQKQGRPTLIFIMGEKHPVTEADIELDPEKREKLEAFRQRVKEKNRIYCEFQDINQFEAQAIPAISRLRERLSQQNPVPATLLPDHDEKIDQKNIPAPPVFYAEPPYLGSHEFVGRRAELERLNDWASPADTHSMMLFEAIGGTGKSMLTWHWVRKYASSIRNDWAGLFWYSFYEKGARMDSFCRYALAYMTQAPVKDFNKKKMLELSELLLAELQAKPWLLVLDGLERILVAYNRSDAAEISDEEVQNPEDKIANRDPCVAIRPEDDDLLRALAVSAPSKLLVSSRLIPRALLNRASQAIPGVLHERLSGLRPADAEALLHSCGIKGNSDEVRAFLQNHCGCHPLVIGVLAGLINQPGTSFRGDFDAWSKAPDGGGQLNLAELDLVKKRNHILKKSLKILPEKSRALLSTLALLSEAADIELLSAFNPHLPKSMAQTEELVSLGKQSNRKTTSHKTRQEKAAKHFAEQQLRNTVEDIEARGLLQYDRHLGRYDLHPVVRGVIAGSLAPEETKTYGQKVIDHFSAKAPDSWENAQTLNDLRAGLQVISTLLRMERYHAAFEFYQGGFSQAIKFNLEAYAEDLALLRAFMPDGWEHMPTHFDSINSYYLINSVGWTMTSMGYTENALTVFSTGLQYLLEGESWTNLRQVVSNISITLGVENHWALAHRFSLTALELANQNNDDESLFVARFNLFAMLTTIGQWEQAERMWKKIDAMGRDWSRAKYRPGAAEYWYAVLCFCRGTLTEKKLSDAEYLAELGKNRKFIRSLHKLRGEWYLSKNEPVLAVESFNNALRMARESGLSHEAITYEVWLTLARVQAKQVTFNEVRDCIEYLKAKDTGLRAMAMLWQLLGDKAKASSYALDAYRWAWADGEPWVQRYELEQSSNTLNELGVRLPDLPPYDPGKDIKFDWEDDLVAAIEKLKTMKKK